MHKLEGVLQRKKLCYGVKFVEFSLATVHIFLSKLAGPSR